MDKSKFTRDPHLDSEGFLDQYQMAYGCHGCAPGESCPRSGHCERYDSPLRYVTVTVNSDGSIGERGTYSDPKCAKCPTVSPWSRIEQRDLDTVHQLWLAERITPQGGF